MTSNDTIGSGSSVALLFVDVQQDYLKKNLYPPAELVLENLGSILSAFRSLDLPVIHSQTLIKPDGSNRMPHQKEQDIWRCIEGTPGSKSPKSLRPLVNEKVLSKTFYSAFSNSELDPFLKGMKIEHLVIAGLYTHACVRETIVDAYEHRYNVTVPADAIASEDILHAEASKQWLESRACRITSTHKIIEELRSKAGTSESGPPVNRPASLKAFPVSFNGGKWKDFNSDDFWEQKNPSKWVESLGLVPIGKEDDVNRTVESANKAQKNWAHKDVQERIEILSNWITELEKREGNFVSLLAREVGKPLDTGRAEFQYGVSLMKETVRRAGHELDEDISSNIGVRYRPLGTVALITPWNNPFAIPLGKIFPALVYGNSVVWKPALQAPQIVSLIADSWKSTGCLESCLNVVFGDATTAQILARHPVIEAVSFTGSIQGGRDLSIITSQLGKRLQAEMGGNNAVLVGRSADAAKIARELVPAVYSFSGQRCTAPRRLIIADEISNEFTEAFISAMEELTIGHPEEPGIQVGPLISRSRQSYIANLIQESLHDGGNLLKGGSIPEDYKEGCWYTPTLVGDIKSTSRIFMDESFGPVAVLSRVENFDEAITVCNSVEQGLSATLHSNEDSEIESFFDTAKAGMLRVNSRQSFFSPEAPFNGWKASGSGIAEHGRWDREFYSRLQTIYK